MVDLLSGSTKFSAQLDKDVRADLIRAESSPVLKIANKHGRS